MHEHKVALELWSISIDVHPEIYSAKILLLNCIIMLVIISILQLYRLKQGANLSFHCDVATNKTDTLIWNKETKNKEKIKLKLLKYSTLVMAYLI